ncbi:MAG: hypothetical protein JWN99_1279, partial [Ilumatobacteraceae bacterium]|nr:hypothetical protein [Ilumatobacteraceae bacterium]
SFRLREEPLREDVTVTGAMVEGMEEAGTVRPNLAGT